MNSSLAWDPTLETAATNYAAKCNFTHSGGGNLYGENLAAAGTSSGTFPYKPWKYQLDGWKNEETNWKCASNACSGVCGHLTAQLWKTTTKIGCGVASCPKNTVLSLPAQYLVCQYTPAGNVGKQHPLNPPATTYASCPSTSTTADVNPSTNPIPIPPPASPAAPLGTAKSPTPTPITPPSPTPTPTTPTPTPIAPTPPTQKYIWSKCIADYWPKGVRTPTACLGSPTTFDATSTSPKGLYCPCGDPQNYFWPVSNQNTSDCPYVVGYTDPSMLTSDETASKQLLPMEAWIGIGVGIAVFIIIVIVIIIVVRNKKDERV